LVFLEDGIANQIQDLYTEATDRYIRHEDEEK
jgi:hypothetical protein